MIISVGLSLYLGWFVSIGVAWYWVCSNLLAIVLLLLQKHFGMISLDPATYYVSCVPVEIDFGVFALINIATLLLSVAVMVLPSYFSSRVSPVKTLKYE